jgi:type II secretory pathway component PulM
MMHLQETMKSVKSRWQQFSAREKIMILIGGAALFFYLFYALIAMPILTGLDNMRKNVDSTQKLVSWMQGADQLINELEKTAHKKLTPESPVELLSIVKTGAEESALATSLVDLRQLGEDSVELHFKNVNTDKLLAFLMSMLNKYAVHLVAMSVSVSGTPGFADVSMTLKVGMSQDNK